MERTGAALPTVGSGVPGVRLKAVSHNGTCSRPSDVAWKYFRENDFKIDSLFYTTNIGGHWCLQSYLTSYCEKKVRDMDMNLVFWIWSTRTRTRTQTKVLVLVLTHFIQYSYSYSYSCLVKYSYSYSGFVYSPQPWHRDSVFNASKVNWL